MFLYCLQLLCHYPIKLGVSQWFPVRIPHENWQSWGLIITQKPGNLPGPLPQCWRVCSRSCVRTQMVCDWTQEFGNSLAQYNWCFFEKKHSTWRRCGYILCSRNSFDEHFFQTNWHLQVILDGPHDVFFVQSRIVCFRWTNIGVGDLTCTLRRRPRRLVPFIHHHRVKWGPSSPSFAFPATIRKRPTGFFLVPESPG